MAMLRRRFTVAAVVALCLLLPVTPALASGADVIVDCNDNGHLTKQYSQKEYRSALAQMPADIRQYTDCENIIRRAQLGQPGSSGGDANSGNPFGTSAKPEEVAKAQADIEVAKKTGGKATRIGRTDVTPGDLAFTKVSAATCEMPTPLLVLIALIVLGGIAALVDRVLVRRREHPGDPGA
jgi:hypothetical protein